MTVNFSSSIKIEPKKKRWIRDHLKKFDTTDLYPSCLNFSPSVRNFCSARNKKMQKLQNPSLHQKNSLIKSVELYQKISSSSSQVFIFSFGGIGASFRTAQSFFSLKSEKMILVDSLNLKNKISKLSSEELKSSHFVFISKSGQTSEILFYKRFVAQIYSKNRLSLKNRLTLLVQNLNSPLFLWGKKEQADIVYLEDSLPGRFSFFTLSGWFQFLACGLKIKLSELRPSSISSQIFDFCALFSEKKEIYFCPFQPELHAISHWLESSWSESLFKENMKQQAPLLRVISWADLQHAFIEELVGKREQVCLWALDIKSDKTAPLKEKLLQLLKSKGIACLFIDVEKKIPAFFDLIQIFYKMLFLAGEFSAVDIKTQPWVDYFKK